MGPAGPLFLLIHPSDGDKWERLPTFRVHKILEGRESHHWSITPAVKCFIVPSWLLVLGSDSQSNKTSCF